MTNKVHFARDERGQASGVRSRLLAPPYVGLMFLALSGNLRVEAATVTVSVSNLRGQEQRELQFLAQAGSQERNKTHTLGAHN